MAIYSNYEQFVTADGLDFMTSDDNHYLVKIGLHSNDDYFQDTTNGQENVNTISFGSYTFGGSKIKTLKLHFESGLLTDQLAIDTLTAEIVSGTRPALTRYTPITVKRGNSVMGVFFNGIIKEVGKQRYSIYAESYISLLDYDYHFGGVYTAVNTGTVVAELMGSIPYTIHPDVAAIKLYGYLPYDTKRNNLLQILIATGAAIERNSNGTINITVLTDTNVGTFGDERVFENGSLDEDTQVTAVQVTEHGYAPITDEITLFSEAFTDTRLATFSEPAHDLVCTNGTILESGANYAKIQGAGAVILTGKKYRHTTKIVTTGTITDTPEDKIVSVTNATLITAINSSSVAKRLLSYAGCNRRIKQDVLINQERTGKMVQTVHPYGEDSLSAAIQSLDFSLSNTMRAAGDFLVGYKPQGITEGYKNRILLTTSGNWTVPSGVTEIRAVLIGGGQGGKAGENGDAGSDGKNDRSLSRASGGKGGKGSLGGTGGKVYETTLVVSPGQVISRTIGQGGNPGLVNGAEGSLGTATSFGGISSDLGVVSDYVDAMTAERFAYTGGTGIDGANADAYSNQGGNVTGPPEPEWPYGRTYYGGSHGQPYLENIGGGQGEVGGAGGKGGGAAVGENGTNGNDASVSSKNNAYGGNGGRGGNATARAAATVYGAGGDGGHGGGGGGGGGDSWHPDDLYAYPGHGGAAGLGGAGGNGASGCIIIYY